MYNSEKLTRSIMEYIDLKIYELIHQNKTFAIASLLSKIATTGLYDDLINKPDIPIKILIENQKIYLIDKNGNRIDSGTDLPKIDLTPYAKTIDLHNHLNKEILDIITNDKINEWNNKVDKVEGKELSTNNLSDILKSNYDTAYNHSLLSHAPSNAQKNSDITKEEIENKLTGDITSHNHTQYLTEHQDLSEYTKESDIKEYISNKEIDIKEYVDSSIEPKDYIFIKDINDCLNIIMIKNGILSCFKRTIGIKIKTFPTKRDYTNSDLFDPTGMVVVAVAEDGSVREITDYTYDKYVTAGAQFHTINYTELGITYSVSFNIGPRPILKALNDFYYNSNSDGTYTITGWKGTYNGNPSREIIIPNSELIII